MPIQITNAVGSATVVFVGVVAEKTKELIKDQFGIAFAGRESDYWIYPITDYLSADTFIDELEQRIRNHELADTDLNFQFLFYEDLKQLDKSRLDSVLQFNRDICTQVAIHGSIIRSVLFVLKDKQNSLEYMERFDGIISSILSKNAEEIKPKLMLIDTRPMSDLYGPVRATVRFAYTMSRMNNQLQTEMTAATVGDLIYVLTMSQFDIQENDELVTEKKRLEGQLDGAITREELADLLKREFKNFVETERAKLEAKAILFGSRMPIPRQAIGGLFYWLKKKSIVRELELLKTAIMQNYVNSVYGQFLKDEQDTIAAFCHKIVNDERIPFAAKESIVDSFRHEKPEISQTEVPRPGRMIPCRGHNELRKGVARVLQDMAKMDLRLEKDLYEAVVSSLGSFVNKEAIQTRKQKMSEELHQIENQLNSMGDAKGPRRYLIDASTITNRLRVYNGISFSQMNEWMLISNEIALQWNEYDAYYPNPVYDCGTLDIHEFEMLRIDGYTADLFRQHSKRFFRVAGGN